MLNSIYSYVNEASDPAECKKCLDKVLDFAIRLRQSYVDNDKPVTSNELNEKILRQADMIGLRVGYVALEEP